MEIEYCPFCKRENDPGAMEVCEHYLGACFDGDWIGGYGTPGWMEAIEAALRDLQATSDLVEERLMAASDPSGIELQVQARFDGELAEVVLSGGRLSLALMHQSPAITQEHPIVHSMTSGWGESYYTDDLEGLLTWIVAFRSELRELRGFLLEVYG